MKKVLLALLLIASMLLSLAACTNEGTSEETGTDNGTEATTDPATEAPTEQATEAPTETPTEITTETPTEAPTEQATEAPTEAPTEAVTEADTEPAGMGDTTKTFVSDLNAQAEGTALNATDLAGFFVCELPVGQSLIENGVYKIGGISDMYADMDGKYAFTVNVAANMEGSCGCAYIFVRGDKSVVPVGFVADTGAGNYKINNYYETAGDPHTYAGASGICINVKDDTLTLIIKVINRDVPSYVGHADFEYAIYDSNIMIVDDNETVAIYAGSELVTTISISDPKTYDDMVASTGVQFAGKVTLTDAEGTSVELTDTLVAATAASQIGLCARAANVWFDEIKVEAWSDVTIPGQPTSVLTYEDIFAATNNNANDMEAELGYKCVKLTSTGSDPYFTLATNLKAGTFAVIKYKTANDASGEFFIANAGGPHGGTDETVFSYENTDGEWNYASVDLTAAADFTGGTAAYIRYDFFTGNNGEISIAYIAFFADPFDAIGYILEDQLTGTEILDRTSDEADFKNYSFDTFYVNGNMYFEQDGDAANKLAAQDNTVTFKYGEAHDSAIIRGWIGFNQPIETFGFYVKTEFFGITMTMFVPGDFAKATEDPVRGAGGEFAQRFEVFLPLDDLTEGTWNIGAAARLDDGRIVGIYEVTFVVEGPADMPEGAGMSPDTYYEDGVQLVDGSAHAWIADNRAGIISGVESAGFRGWCGLGEAEIAEYGYAIGDMAPVFSSDFVVAPEGGLAAAAQQPNVTRYLITVDFTGITEPGTYSVVILVKDTDGNIYRMAKWGDIAFYVEEPEPELPVADIFDLQYTEDGKFINAVDGEELVVKGSKAPTVSEDGAINFDRANKSYLKLESFGSLYDTTLVNGYTFEVVAKLNDTKMGYIFSNLQAGGFGLGADTGWNNDDVICFLAKTTQTDGYAEIDFSGFETDTYYHLVCVYNPALGEIAYYVNGGTEMIASTNAGGDIIPPSKTADRYLAIGADSGVTDAGENFMNGSIKIARMYSEVLSEEQIALLYESYIFAD